MSYINPVNKPLCLQMLYEDNYHRLLKIFPSLKHPLKDTTASLSNPNCRLTLLDQAPYTLTFSLQSLDSAGQAIEPIINCRFYLDCQSVEVLEVKGFVANLTKYKHDSPSLVLDKKWVLNYFLEQWLNFKSKPINKPSTLSKPVNA